MDEIGSTFAQGSYDLGYHHAMQDFQRILEKDEDDASISLEVQKLIHFYMDAHMDVMA
jgi:hypothetical protein